MEHLNAAGHLFAKTCQGCFVGNDFEYEFCFLRPAPTTMNALEGCPHPDRESAKSFRSRSIRTLFREGGGQMRYLKAGDVQQLIDRIVSRHEKES